MRKIVAILLFLMLIVEPAAAKTQVLRIKGHRYYPLYSICEKKDIDYSWDSIGRIATLTKNGIEAKIRVASDRILIDNNRLEDIGQPLRFYNGMVIVPSSFADRGIDKIFKHKAYVKKRSMAQPTYTIETIVLDPGHGGKDPGAIGRYYRLKEKDVNLDIAKRLKNLLLSHGIRVYLTRGRDVFVSLPDRAEFAAKKDADFFISIHSNSSRSRWLRGFEVYYLSERTDDNSRALKASRDRTLKLEDASIDKHNSTAKAIAYDLKFTENRIESKELSRCLIKHAKKKNVYTRRNSLKDARFHVLKNFKTDMPAVLVEAGYLSNKKEEGLLKLSYYKQRIAEALANGVLAYKKEYEKLNGFTR